MFSVGKGKGHIPIRTCICCRTKGPKEQFVRLVADSRGRIVRDKKGDMEGRGAYICKNTKCLERLFKHKQLRGVFKTDRQLIISHELKTGEGFTTDQINKMNLGGMDG